MSKKNNKNRKKKYVEMLKQMEKDDEKEAKRKKAQKEARIATNKLAEEIDDIGLDEKSEKMEVEKKETTHHKKKGFRRKHGRYA